MLEARGKNVFFNENYWLLLENKFSENFFNKVSPHGFLRISDKQPVQTGFVQQKIWQKEENY
jgi:hypothetical protein